jgi:cytochrome c oxidase assembly protein subunit 15
VAPDTVPLVDLAPLLPLLGLAALLALLPLAWVWLRARRGDARARLAALTALTLFLTFDLIVFGAFTRLSDSGLGCPDWPGCYGAATPIGARDEIRAAEAALPGGPVTWSKAWIEMIHRYLAMTVGALILVMAAAAWAQARASRRAASGAGAAAAPGLPVSPWLPTLTLVWVIVQGLFGKYTVTLKLYPAVVTLHLLGGLALLALLAVQHQAFRRAAGQPVLALPAGLRRGAWAVLALLVVQIALGGWVSTNYAVLACSGFPQCNGQWWPAMDWAQGFVLRRELGHTGGGGLLPFEALVAIHMAHRLGAVVVVVALGWLVWRLARVPAGAAAGDAVAAAAGQAGTGALARRFGFGLAAVGLLQVVSGLSNVVLGWPLVAALGHSAGAAALVLLLTLLLARSAPARTPQTAAHAASAQAASGRAGLTA